MTPFWGISRNFNGKPQIIQKFNDSPLIEGDSSRGTLRLSQSGFGALETASIVRMEW
jgi:hypothetical protein